MRSSNWLWRTIILSGRCLGPRIGPRAVGPLTRLLAARDDGHELVARRLLPGAMAPPGLERFPDAWWAAAPLVSRRYFGVSLLLDLRDNLQRVLYFTGSYERQTLDVLRQELRPGDVVVDVGAHVGVHALVLAKRLKELGGGEVVAIEAASDSAARIRTAAAKNSLDVRVVHAAVAETERTVELRCDNDWGTADTGVRSIYGSGTVAESTRAETFDGFAARNGITRLDVVKIDVEGCEPAVIQGMLGTLEELRPRVLVIETKESTLARAGAGPADLVEMLARAGYMFERAVDRNTVFRPTM